MMELNDTLARTKGIIFAGCSFTWGQGLWYYMNSSTVQEDTKDTAKFYNQKHPALAPLKALAHEIMEHFGI